jgi:hypothetical protein
MGLQPAVALRILEKGHYFLQFELGLVDAGHVGEGDPGVFLDIDLGPRLADRHQAAETLICHPASNKHPDQIKQHNRHHP